MCRKTSVFLDKIYWMSHQTQNQNVAQTANYLKFDSLPKQIQERLLEKQRGGGEGFAFKTASILSAPFFIAIAFVWIAIVFYFADDYLWSNFQVGFFAITSIGALYLLLFNLYKLFQWFTSRSKCYLLITPYYVIEMRFNGVWYWDLDQLNGASGTRQYQSNKSASTKITLSFDGGVRKTFDVKGIESSEQTIEQIYYYKKLFAEATARNDSDYLDSNDDFLELRNQTRQSEVTAPNGNLNKLLTAASIILTGGMMFGAVSLNNYYDDRKSYNSAESANRASSFRTYLQTHPQGRWTNDARQKLQGLYDAAGQKYQTSLTKDYDQKAADAVLQILNYARATQNYRVKVAFERHNEIPENIVEQLKEEYEAKEILALGDTFSDAKMSRREDHLFTVTADAFKYVIPDDILEFSTECGGECVTFLVKYNVGSKGSLYYDNRQEKLPDAERTFYPGIDIYWDFDIKIPNQSQNYNFELESSPATEIFYDSNSDETTSGKDDFTKILDAEKSYIYDSMVESAFDDFRINLIYRMGIGTKPKRDDEETANAENAPAIKQEKRKK